jgi:hypothetical protein
MSVLVVKRCRSRCIRVKTQEVYKFKVRLDLDGSHVNSGKDYDLTFAPVASWESVRILLALVLRRSRKTKQLDYVLAFPRAGTCSYSKELSFMRRENGY